MRNRRQPGTAGALVILRRERGGEVCPRGSPPSTTGCLGKRPGLSVVGRAPASRPAWQFSRGSEPHRSCVFASSVHPLEGHLVRRWLSLRSTRRDGGFLLTGELRPEFDGIGDNFGTVVLILGAFSIGPGA